MGVPISNRTGLKRGLVLARVKKFDQARTRASASQLRSRVPWVFGCVLACGRAENLSVLVIILQKEFPILLLFLQLIDRSPFLDDTEITP